MRLSSAKRKWAVCAVVIAMGALLSLWVARRRQEPVRPDDGLTGGQASRLARGPTSKSAPATVPTVSEPGLLADWNPNVLVTLRGEAIPQGTISELIEKGFPPISVPRQRALMQTARQSTEEVVADLGNFFVLADSSDRNVADSLGSIRRWNRTIPRNLKVLRLIEEGREDPAGISRLLRQAIRDAISAYGDLLEARKRPVDSAATKGIQANDPYYAKHKRYRSRSFEKDRIHFVVNASFYVLANIGELGDPKLLAEWIRQEKPGATCRGMQVWLIDRWYATETGRESPYAVKHRELIGDAMVSGKRKKMSKWNAPWSIHDSLVTDKQVNLSGLPTIEVLDIPERITITTEYKKQIIAGFIAAIKREKP